MLFCCLNAMIIWSIIQLFFHPGPVGRTIFALLGAILFSAYLVLDTQMLISRFGESGNGMLDNSCSIGGFVGWLLGSHQLHTDISTSAHCN